MNLNEIEKNAKALMAAHGVGSLDVAFDRAKRRIGATHFFNCGTQGHPTWIPAKITLSKHYVAGLSDDEVMDVMLHEIAHALAGKLAGHGPVWKRHAVKVGAQPNRCKSVDVKVEPAVKAYCLACDSMLDGGFHRLPLTVKKHGHCPAGGTGRDLNYFKNGERLLMGDMPERFQNDYWQIYGRLYFEGSE
jgi:predicted SprT family Zn-dependent metalloprotease